MELLLLDPSCQSKDIDKFLERKRLLLQVLKETHSGSDERFQTNLYPISGASFKRETFALTVGSNGDLQKFKKADLICDPKNKHNFLQTQSESRESLSIARSTNDHRRDSAFRNNHVFNLDKFLLTENIKEQSDDTESSPSDEVEESLIEEIKLEEDEEERDRMKMKKLVEPISKEILMSNNHYG